MASYWVIQDFPDTATFLTQEERKNLKLLEDKNSKIGYLGAFVVRRLTDDMKLSAGGESFHKEYIWQSLTDWKTWVASALRSF